MSLFTATGFRIIGSAVVFACSGGVSLAAADHQPADDAGQPDVEPGSRTDAGSAALQPLPVPRFFNREREDWRLLRDRPDDDPFLGLKHIALGDDPQTSLTLGATARLRYEHFENFAFRPQHDDGYLLSHARLHADLRIGENVRAFAEGSTNWVTERDLPGGTRTIDEDQIDLLQGWVSFTFPAGDDATAELRLGRQQLNFGGQRLVSPLPWANTFRAWDGVLLDLTVADWKITPFWTTLVPVRRFDFNRPSEDRQLWGVYATGSVGDGFKADVYFLGTDNQNATTTNGTTGSQRRRTVGARLSRGKGPGRFDLDAEGAVQFGRSNGNDILAYFVDAEAGYTFAGSWTPRLAVGGGVASGDNSAGGDIQTFDPLFPLGHAYHGFADQIGRQNVIETRAVAEVKPTKKLKLRTGAHVFWRADSDDGVYNAGGGLIRPGGASDQQYLGFEIDFTGTYTISRNAVFEAGYSYFRGSDFFAVNGIRSDVHFVYSQLILKY